jgi:hypothetical protein
VLERLKGQGTEAEDSDDGSYLGGDEEDIPLDPESEEEDQPLFDQIQNPNLNSTTNKMSGRSRSTKLSSVSSGASTPSVTSSTHTTVITPLIDPHVISYPTNNKVFVQLPMGGNVDKDDDFLVELKPTRVEGWLCIPKELEIVSELLGDEGRLSVKAENCPHCVVFQAEIDKRIKATSTIKRDKEGHLWMLQYNLPIPSEVGMEYYDKYGERTDNFMIQSNNRGFYYAQFWLKVVPANKAQGIKAKGRRVGKAKKSQQW